MNTGLFNNIAYKRCLQIINIDMYKQDLAFNNLQGLIGKRHQTPTYKQYFFV